jgi:hypothetical protein
MWGPVLGWCALELLAESISSIDAEEPQRIALDLFDRLRLREPFAHAFAALGFEGEEAWRVAARIKVLLTEAGVGKAKEAAAEADRALAQEVSPPVADASVNVYEATAAEAELAIPASDPAPASGNTASGESAVHEDESGPLSPNLWLDADVRWLTGVHETQGVAYFVREPYEELLWWLLLPSLLRLAAETVPCRTVVEQMSKGIKEALAAAEAAGYRIDALVGRCEESEPEDAAVSEIESQQTDPERAETAAEEVGGD